MKDGNESNWIKEQERLLSNLKSTGDTEEFNRLTYHIIGLGYNIFLISDDDNKHLYGIGKKVKTDKQMDMKENTVILDVETYNNLRDFRKTIESGGFVHIQSGTYSYREDFFTKDDGNAKLIKEIEELSNQIEDLKTPPEIIVDPEEKINEIKKMNWWQFRKWKKLQNK